MNLSNKNALPFAFLPARPHPAWIWAGFSLLLLCIILNAWVSDDAYITFRTVFNLTEGHGPVYNVGERVQTFTNPLWMFLMSGLYAFTGEAYFTSLALSFAMVAAGTWLLLKRVVGMGWNALAMMLAMLCSLSFVEYSTSGLENVLNFFLLSVFLTIWTDNRPDSRRLFWLALVTGLGTFSRMDTLLLYLPVLAWAWWQQRSLRSVFLVAAGFLPFILWEFFCLFYYGFPFPNTAYAKLNAGLTDGEMFRQGLKYFAYTFRNDPISIAVMALGAVMAFRLPLGRWLPVLAGMALYSVYIVRIGGDFMGGRFIYLPFVLGAVLLAKGLETGGYLRWLYPLVLLLGLANVRAPQYHWAVEIEGRVPWQDGIADERAWYYTASALIDWKEGDWAMLMERQLDSLVAIESPQKQYLFWDCIGYTGYGVGPNTHVVDRFALADPLLARLPMAWEPDWRIGHFSRIVPWGYRNTLRKGVPLIEDPDLQRYYDKLCILTRGDLWSWERLKEIWRFNTGKYEHLIDKAHYAYPSPLTAELSELSTRQKERIPFGDKGQFGFLSKRPLRILMGKTAAYPSFDISLATQNTYVLSYWLQGKEIAKDTVLSKWLEPDVLSLHRIETPRKALDSGFDEVMIEGMGGNEHYAVGHFIPVE